MEAIGKLPVVCGVAPGYIVPRLQALVMNEAARMIEEGAATAEEIDKATRYGLGLRFAALGVVEFIDFGGADILHHASREMAGSIDRGALRRAGHRSAAWSSEGRLGLKSGSGFYDYAARDVAAYRRDVLAAHARPGAQARRPVAAAGRQRHAAVTASDPARVRRPVASARCTTPSGGDAARRRPVLFAAPDAAQLGANTREVLPLHRCALPRDRHRHRRLRRLRAPVRRAQHRALGRGRARELLDALGIARAHVVGHHTGGVIAVELAAALPDRVARAGAVVDAVHRRRPSAAARAERPPIDAVEPSDDGSHLAALWQQAPGVLSGGPARPARSLRARCA